MEEENTMASKMNPLSEEQIEQLAAELRTFLLDVGMWQDVTIYFNGKAFSTYDKENGKRDMEEAEDEGNTEEYERLEEKLEALESLDTGEDIDWFCNCLDTSIWFAENEDIYREYLADEISDVEDNMGFSF